MDINLYGRTVTVPDEIVAMYEKLTRLQRDIALNKLQGMTNNDAYINASGKATGERSISACSSEILANPNVQDFITHCERLKFGRELMTREEMIDRLSMMARTQIDDVLTFVQFEEEFMNVKTGEVINGQTYWTLKKMTDMKNGGLAAISEMTAGKDGLKIKLHDQKAAMKQLALLMGYEKPRELTVNGKLTLDDLYGTEGIKDE